MNAHADENKTSDSSRIWLALIGALASVVVALITTLGTLWVKTSELEAARQGAERAADRARAIPEEAEQFGDRFGSPVGTIVASLLPPSRFWEIVGDPPSFDPHVSHWAPADGLLNIGASRYGRLTNSETSPDLRGLFLRGLNSFDTSKPSRSDVLADPDGSRVPGSPQASTIERHMHLITNGENGLTIGNVTAGGKNQMVSHYRYGRGDSYAKPEDRDVFFADYYGTTETRPANAAVFYYLRIN